MIRPRLRFTALALFVALASHPTVSFAQPQLPDPPAPSGAPAAPAPAAAPEPEAAPEPPDGVPSDAPSMTPAPAQDEAPADASGYASSVPEELRVDDPRFEHIQVRAREQRGPITIEEIVNPVIISASRRNERALDAPALVITLSAQDLSERGYTELSEILDDLPGMDVIRPFGDTYLRSYWRGYRNEIGAPYLFMIDGVSFNHLYLNDNEIMATVPLSSVERVEVVYGPASAVYGPNAAMGIINVITKAPKSESEAPPSETAGSLDARLALRTPTSSFRMPDMTKIADMHVLFQRGELSLSAAGRFEVGVLEPAIGERYEYTRNRYYADRDLWGDFALEVNLAGEFRSPTDKRGFDARLRYGGTELAFQYFRMLNGGGTVYPADFAQTKIPFVRRERSVYVRHDHRLSSHALSTTMLRYRESDIPNPTGFLERINEDNTIVLSYWQSTNSSVEGTQDLVIDVGPLTDDDNLQLNFGLKYERRDLEQSYLINGYENPWPADEPFTGGPSGDYEFPIPPAEGRVDTDNRSTVDVAGAYALAKYSFLRDHSVDFGVRVDYAEILGTTQPTLRGGYVGRFIDGLTAKLLYGQAFQEPPSRVLFGAFADTGNPDLEPERSQTLELALEYLTSAVALLGDVYYVDYSDAIQSSFGPSVNIAERHIAGADLGLRAVLSRSLKLWAYYSTYLLAEESQVPAPGEAPSSELIDIGDLARHKVIAGATAQFERLFGLTLLGRCIGPREPVQANPLGTVPGYCLLDGHLFFHLPGDLEGLSLALRVTNLLDTEIFHPGIREADAGNTPGFWDPDTNEWVGSGGFANARLPQPGRAITLLMNLRL